MQIQQPALPSQATRLPVTQSLNIKYTTKAGQKHQPPMLCANFPEHQIYVCQAVIMWEISFSMEFFLIHIIMLTTQFS